MKIIQSLKDNIKKIFSYVENIWLGDDGKPSGKRISGFFLTYKAVSVANTAISKNSDLSQAAILCGTLLAGALAFWGITTYQQLNSQK